jgi:hypothetical protein
MSFKRGDMKMIKYFVTLSFIFVYGSTFANTNAKTLELEIAKVVRAPLFVESVLDQYGLHGMPRQVIKEHFLEIYKNNEVIEMIVKELLNAGAEKWDKKTQFEYGRKFGAELFLTYALKGMRRLDYQDQRSYIKLMLNWMEVASDIDCKKLIVEGGKTSASEDSNLEMKYYHLIEKEILRNYFLILRKSILAEIRDFPSVRNINQQQALIAESAYESRLLSRVESGLVDYKMLEAMIDLPNADPKLACSAGKQIFATILSLDGFVGDLFLLKFINSLQ